MRVLVALTYYRPHVSGLTIYAERLATGLAAAGHDVTVLTSRYDRALPATERRDGVDVVRVPVAGRISRGVLLPTFGAAARSLAREHDVVNVHLPQFDGWRAVRAARGAGKAVVATVHCQLHLADGGGLARLAGAVTGVADRRCLAAVDRIVAYTEDYASHASELARHRARTTAVLPPVVLPEPDPAAVTALRAAHGIDGTLPTLGLACRFSHEKGIEVLLDAVDLLERRGRAVRVLFAGPYGDVVGERDYWLALRPRVEAMGDRWRFAGTLDAGAAMAAFYAAVDCLVVSSVNSTEAFGLVQVEAMLCGTPVVACDLPGVRQPVGMTGMGRIARTGDASSFADAIEAVLDGTGSLVRPRSAIAGQFAIEATVAAYERILGEAEAARRGAR